MILRRVISHVRNQEWTAIGIDFLIVVLGVFIGIQVSNWNAARGEAQDAAAYRQRIVDDIHTELSGIDARVAYYQVARAHGLAALAALQGPLEEREGTFLVDLYQATQEWSFNPARTAYNEMVSAGRINLIADTDLRKRLGVYYSELDEYVVSWSQRTAYRNSVRTLLPISLQEQIYEACEDVFVDESGSTRMAQPEACSVAFAPEQITRGVAAAASAPDLSLLLNRHLSVLDEKLRDFSDRKDQANAMIAHLGATL